MANMDDEEVGGWGLVKKCRKEGSDVHHVYSTTIWALSDIGKKLLSFFPQDGSEISVPFLLMDIYMKLQTNL